MRVIPGSNPGGALFDVSFYGKPGRYTIVLSISALQLLLDYIRHGETKGENNYNYPRYRVVCHNALPRA